MDAMHAIVEIRNLTRQERMVIDAFLRQSRPVSQKDLQEQIPASPSQATLSRVMNALILKGLLVKEGRTRGARFSLTTDAKRVATDPRRRPAIPYDPGRIGGYVPNESRWLPDQVGERMKKAVEDAGGQRLDPSTYGKAIAERFLIDLSWASSHLEGNTYDHLSTEVLIKYGQGASGRDRVETAMILNHKAAISAMIDGFESEFPDVQTVQRRHVLMMRDLMDPHDLGAIRRSAVQITATSYRPSSDHTLLSAGLSDLLAKARQVEDPFEASFLLLAGLSYLQAFGDGNKRMGRMLSNEPLLRAGLPPLSFVGIEKTRYILGLIEFYETGTTALLSEALAESYAYTASDYVRSFTVQRVPHALELRERTRIACTVGQIFLNRIPPEGIAGQIDGDFSDLKADERAKLVEIVSGIADHASPASAFLYGVTAEDISARQGRTAGNDRLPDGL